MKIVYGIHGYGRGHAMRAKGVLGRLSERHELLILAGGDAYDALIGDYPVVRIPIISYRHNRRGKIASIRTVVHNTPMILDLMAWGPGLDMVMQVIRDFGADLVITDSEGYTHWAARRLGIPRITFDHFGVLVYCRPDMSRWDRVVCWSQSLAYRLLFGRPDRLVVSCFFHAPPRRDGVCVVGPVIRPEVRAITPTRGEHILAYINQGEREYTPQIEKTLLSLDCPVRVYGTPRRGLQANLQFKPVANLPFIEDLAGSRAVFATSGNQLCGEALHFGKPMLAMPLACFEQRLNAQQIELMGVGRQVRRGHVTPEVFRQFLAREDEYRANAERHQSRNGEVAAFEAIERYASELTGKAGDPATAVHAGSKGERGGNESS